MIRRSMSPLLASRSAFMVLIGVTSLVITASVSAQETDLELIEQVSAATALCGQCVYEQY